MSSRSRELVFLILQFLEEEKFKESVHKLEQESGFFFNMKYFEEQVQAGEWDEVERYLSGCTKVDDNEYSMKIFFEIRQQKYLEALDKQDRGKAVDILVKDLKVFASFNEELYKETTQLLTLENFRENEQFSEYGDTKSARGIMLIELKKLIEVNPLFRDKLTFPPLKASRLRSLINQSLNWQHQLCKNPRSNPDIRTLFVDHSCGPPNRARAPPPSNNLLVGALPKAGAFPPLTNNPFPLTASSAANAFAGWMASSNPATPNVVGAGPAGLGAPFSPPCTANPNWAQASLSPVLATSQIPLLQISTSDTMSSLISRELVFLILQFLDEEKFKESVLKLEQESCCFFSMKYFEEQVQAGEWDEVERYLSGFTKVDDNRYSMKIFFEIRKQKYLEALDKQDCGKAVDILVKDFTQLLTLENFRENEQLFKYEDTKSARGIMLVELKKLIEANPLFRDKLVFPALKASRLRTLIIQSLNWQHQLCKNPRSNPDIKTLFVDHSCGPPNGTRAPIPSNNLLVGALPKAGAFPPITHNPFPPAASPAANALAGWMANSNPATPNVVGAGPAGLGAPPSLGAATLLRRPRSPPNSSTVDYQSGDSEHFMKRSRPVGQAMEEVSYPGGPMAMHPSSMYSSEDLPKTAVRTLNQGSCVMSMDFHPTQQTILLAGTNVGDIAIWDVASKDRLASKNFRVWNISICSLPMQTAMVKDPAVSVNRCMWSPDGNLLGVAFSKHIVHVYAYNGGSDFREHLEIDAHLGGVNDLAFSHPNKQLCIITCGDDKTIKVWDANNGRKQYTFEGHEASVYSVCPHRKENIPFIFSTAVDGKIKAWLYDLLGSRVDYDAPGHWCTTMAYSADGSRLFSCGTSKEGESFLVEWNESEGAIKRTYSGFRKRSLGVVQFDTTKNHFLAAGDEFQIKFWDMENINLLTTTDAEGGLPASPRLRFNKDGSLLAVTTNDNGIKVLANSQGLWLLHTLENRPENRVFESTQASVEPVISKPLGVNSMAVVSAAPSGVFERVSTPASLVGMNSLDGSRSLDVKPKIEDPVSEKSKVWKLLEITDSAHCRTMKLPDNLPTSKVLRLIYTNAGIALLALLSNAVHKLWKWQRSDRNVSGKATAALPPHLWQPASGILMTNDIGGTNPEEAVPCIALSKNDSYVMSASGGKVSLFNMMTFKVMTTFMSPPPVATFLVFHPQDNNIIAIGMEDSSIHIYNVRVDEVKSKLKGHQKRISGLAFSNTLDVLVSSGADAQVCVWAVDAWEKRRAKFLQPQAGRPAPTMGDTRVQFHDDQIRLLVVHESQLAVYDVTKLERIRQWVPHDSLPALISNATYSCDSQLVYASFCDGAVGVFDAESLLPRCRLAPSVYTGPGSSSSAYPLVIAAHPSEPNQFAIGLTDGGVHVLEPLETDGRWGTSSSPAENGVKGVLQVSNSQVAESAAPRSDQKVDSLK